MSYLKNLLVLLFALIPFCAAGTEYQVKVDSTGTYSAFESVPPPKPLFTGKFPDGFPAHCLVGQTLGDGDVFSCPTTTLAGKRFDLSFPPAVIKTTEERNYSVTVTDSGLAISSDVPKLKPETDSFFTIFAVYIVAFGILVLSGANGWVSAKRQRLLVFHGILFGSIAAGGITGWLAGGLAGSIVGMLAGASAGIFAGSFAGKIFSISAGGGVGIIAGDLTGVLAGKYGWSNAGITEYLVFIGIVCLIGWALREVVAFARNRSGFQEKGRSATT